jgi:hypothetical protein
MADMNFIPKPYYCNQDLLKMAPSGQEQLSIPF